MQASVRTCWVNCTCKLLLMIQALVCQFPTRKWWFISGPPGGAEGALCSAYISRSVTATDTITLCHMLWFLGGHWSFAKYTLSVTLFCIVTPFLSASHPFLVFCFIFISVIYLIFPFVSQFPMFSPLYSLLFLHSDLSIYRAVLSFLLVVLEYWCALFLYTLRFLLPPNYFSFIGPYTLQFRTSPPPLYH